MKTLGIMAAMMQLVGVKVNLGYEENKMKTCYICGNKYIPNGKKYCSLECEKKYKK